MLGHASEEREGALLRRLKGVARGARPSGFGFVAGEEGTKRRALVVVARVPYGPALAREVRAVAETGVDGIEIVLREGLMGSTPSPAISSGRSAPPDAVTGTLREAMAAVSVPCGVFLAGSKEEWSAVLDVDGLDWVHLPPEAPARLLAAKEITRLISLVPDMPPARLAGLPGLRADVLVLDDPGQGGPFTADTLLALCAVEAATQKRVLAASGLGLGPDDVKVVHDHGVDGVLVTGGVDLVRAFIDATEGLSAL
jgi:hypothetical protein